MKIINEIRSAMNEGFNVYKTAAAALEKRRRELSGNEYTDEYRASELQNIAIRRDFDILQLDKRVRTAIDNFKIAARRKTAYNAADVLPSTLALFGGDVPLTRDDYQFAFDTATNPSTKRYICACAESKGVDFGRKVFTADEYGNAADALYAFYRSAMQRPQWEQQWLNDLDVVTPECLRGADL